MSLVIAGQGNEPASCRRNSEGNFVQRLRSDQFGSGAAKTRLRIAVFPGMWQITFVVPS